MSWGGAGEVKTVFQYFCPYSGKMMSEDLNDHVIDIGILKCPARLSAISTFQHSQIINVPVPDTK